MYAPGGLSALCALCASCVLQAASACLWRIVLHALQCSNAVQCTNLQSAVHWIAQ